MRISDWSSDVCSSDLGELRRGVVHDDRAVDFRQETLGGPRILGDDRVGVAARMRIDMRKRAGKAVDHGDRDDRVEIFAVPVASRRRFDMRSEEHTSELQSLMRISYAVFCLKKKRKQQISHTDTTTQIQYHISTATHMHEHN